MTQPAPSPTDPWLERWLPLVAGRAGGQQILELGCGSGRDTETLAGAGLAVVGIEVVGHDTAWPARFEAERRLLQAYTETKTPFVQRVLAGLGN